MPIAISCKACGKKYRVVDTASGRRVKCRQCGERFYLPGQPLETRALISPKLLKELEETAIPSTSDQDAWIRYQAVVSTLPERTPIRTPSNKADLLAAVKSLLHKE